MPRLSLASIEKVPGGRAFARLSRRVRTLIVAGVLFLVLFVLALTMPVPYVVLSPGPTCNTLSSCYHQPVITIDGLATAKTTGHLNLTTVGVTTQSITAFQALSGWLASDEVVVPRSAVYPPGQSQQQTDAQNTQEFSGSQDNATSAALCLLGYPRGFGILSVSAAGASHGILRPGDLFAAVANQPANTEARLRTVLSTQRPGTRVPVEVNRQGTPTTVTVRLGPPSKSRKGASLGVVVTTSCLAPFTIKLGLGNEIGGPSAGLMFALGIIDKIGRDRSGRSYDLTAGQFIAGTGEITAAGAVEPIGGIQLKMIAAKRKGATVFLAPAGNCSDVRGAIPAGLKVVKVSTLTQAVDDLLAIQRKQPVPSC
ncbi:PDZ domain-containing protein [uncultured Jatrophihabitans sp.]|uniref:YlbL family protein n=1 Tax=uncultured Jatrophihabitans sp. TaxID=1610747 RepID=UPI0035CB57D8